MASEAVESGYDSRLVVIAIIGILVAMLYPVFAKARESARKVQCLSNVKNIAMAVQIYLAEWDRFWPSESEMRAITYFNAAPGGGTARTLPDICNHATHANPYLQVPVILEEYVGSRDVWKCPSARLMTGGEFIVPMGRGGYWVNNYIDQPSFGKDHWDDCGGPCNGAFPTGWGGEVTDSLTQMRMASPYGGDEAGPRPFASGLSVNSDARGRSLSSIQDFAWYIVVADGGRQMEFWDSSGISWPDTCHLNVCGVCSGTPGCCNADWVNCELTRVCGLDWSMLDKFWSDPSYRKRFTRHLGGSNCGFADGHAKFFLSEAIMNQAPPRGDDFEGIYGCYP